MAVKVDHDVVRVVHAYRGHRSRNNSAGSVDNYYHEQGSESSAELAQKRSAPGSGADDSPDDHEKHSRSEHRGVLGKGKQRQRVKNRTDRSQHRVRC